MQHKYFLPMNPLVLPADAAVRLPHHHGRGAGQPRAAHQVCLPPGDRPQHRYLQDLHNICTISTQYLHNIYTIIHNIYTISTQYLQYLHNIYNIHTISTLQDSLVLDMATATVAVGKLEVAAVNNQQIPGGWAVDGRGRQTQARAFTRQGHLMTGQCTRVTCHVSHVALR